MTIPNKDLREALIREHPNCTNSILDFVNGNLVSLGYVPLDIDGESDTVLLALLSAAAAGMTLKQLEMEIE